MPEIRVTDDPAAEAAEILAEAVRARGHIALAGGSTPRAAYRRVAEMPDLDWPAATLWFGDERCVPDDDELSNYRMVREALLDRLGGEGPAVRRIPAERGPSVAADDYERELRETLGEELPRLDLVLLGIGPDAHTASLFPNQPSLRVADRLAVGVEEAGLEPLVPRVTLTLPVINAARRVVFLVAGEDKSDAVRRAFGGERTADAPASLVSPAGELELLLDPGAASRLPGAA
ncbi:MAG TPA: 6-phosphogluconolactonase [Thermoleophilaceae bacterium]|jgi:6-phosphogluconolactonase